MKVKNDVYIEAIQQIAFDSKRMFDDYQLTPDKFFIDNVGFINMDLSEWTNEVSSEIIQMFVDQANEQKNPLRFLERLKKMFEAERLAIEKKIGTNYFDSDNQIIFGVKFYADIQTGQNESRKFSNCIDMAVQKITINPTSKQELSKFTGAKLFDVYDPEKVHKEFKSELKCDYKTFEAWFVDSNIYNKQMQWTYKRGNKTQLRSFIYILCGGWKPAQTNAAFKISVDSNVRDTQINNDLLQRLEKCRKD